MNKNNRKIGLKVGLMTLMEVTKRLILKRRPLEESLQQIIDNQKAIVQLKKELRLDTLSKFCEKIHQKIQNYLNK